MPTCWVVVEISMPFRDGFSFSSQRCARNQLLPGNLQWESAAKERKWKEASEIHWWDAITRPERHAQVMPVQIQEHFYVWSLYIWHIMTYCNCKQISFLLKLVVQSFSGSVRSAPGRRVMKADKTTTPNEIDWCRRDLPHRVREEWASV